MLDHVSIGVRDVAAAKRFYDAALKPLGYACLSDSPGSLGYGSGSVTLWISETERPVPADEGVKAFHAAALSAGGRDNGRPGFRTDYGPDYYAAFVIDPTGYRLEAYCNAAKEG